MSNPSDSIKYTNKCTLTVKAVDNLLSVYLDPDTAGASAQVYQFHNQHLGTPSPAATIDLMPVLGSQVGPSANMTLIGSNFQGGGYFAIGLQTDHGSKSFTGTLKEWQSQQWSVRILKS